MNMFKRPRWALLGLILLSPLQAMDLEKIGNYDPAKVLGLNIDKKVWQETLDFRKEFYKAFEDYQQQQKQSETITKERDIRPSA